MTSDADWTQTTWGNLATLEYGKAIRGYQTKTDGFPVYGTNGPIGFHENALCDHSGVIIGRKGAYRGVCYSPGPFFVIDTAFYLKLKSDIDLRWAYFQLLTIDINGMDSGSAIPSTSREEFYRLPVAVPPKHEQVAIADFLQTFDSRIDNLRATNATLEAIAQALFKSWFVAFDPVHAKAEGRAPEGMDAATAALFPSEFEDSELGPVPKGWRAYEFGEIANLVKGTVKPGDTPDTTFEHYSLPAYDTGQMPAHEQGDTIKSNKTPVPSGAVLISKLNPRFPRVWWVGTAGEHAICSTELLVWEPKAGFNQSILYCAATSREFNAAMCQLVTGTSSSHQRVRPAALVGVHAMVASEATISLFDEAVRPMLEQVDHNRNRIQTLANLRDALLPRLISGKLQTSHESISNGNSTNKPSD